MKSRYASKVMFCGYSYRESETVFSLALVFGMCMGDKSLTYPMF